MGEISMPSGRYISLNYSLRALTGGQTRASLMRNRMFAQEAGIEPIMITLDSAPVYDSVREQLMEQGQLVAPMQLLNLYEFYRHNPPIVMPRPRASADDDYASDSDSELDGAGEEIGLRSFDELDRVEELHPDGTLYSTTYVDHVYEKAYVQDLHRSDGSVYLRRPVGPTAPKNPMSPYQLVDADGKITASWTRNKGLHKFWLRQLAGDAERVLVISDSRFALRTVVPIADRRFHVLHLMHNIHLVGTRLWNATLSPDYAPLLNAIADIDGLVTLTDRQRTDVAERYGRTNNLFVVPNPVELPTPPEPRPARDPMKIIVVSRLETQKKLEDAVEAFVLVLKAVPEARLDIYGKGSHQAKLAQLIEDLDVGHAVKLCGHDPSAREKVWTATAFLMSSRNEGYPLASLESMARGCPVISYDIKYGPREQITEGVDGFLVEPGDIEALAERMVRMIRDPELAGRMSQAALIKGRQHGYDAFLADWKRVLEQTVENKPGRTRFDDVEYRLTECGYVPDPSTLETLSRRLPGRRDKLTEAPMTLATSASFDRPPQFRVAGSLRVVGKGRAKKMDAAKVTLEAVCDETAAVVSLPVKVKLNKRRLKFQSSFDAAEIFAELGKGHRSAWLRLRLVWSNSCWETRVGRPVDAHARYEVSFTSDGDWLLHGDTGAKA